MVDVAPIYQAFQFKGLELIWIFSENKDGEPADSKFVNHFVNTTQVLFPVLRDFNFEQVFDVLPGEGELPVQFLIDPRTMELVHVSADNAEVAWDKLSALLNAD